MRQAPNVAMRTSAMMAGTGGLFGVVRRAAGGGSIFLTEQLLLALAGGAVGFLLGLILARVLGTSVFGTPAEPRLILLPIILGLAALVAIAGSLIPLRRAARFDPVPILRGE